MFFSDLVNWVPHPTVAAIVQRTPFKVFLDLNNSFAINHHLLEVICEHFDKDRFCFRLGSNNDVVDLVITLEDVLYITGLPIDGKPVTGKESVDYRDLIIEKLGIEPEEGPKASKVGNKFRLEWHRVNFKDVPEGAGDDVIWFYLRAYLLHILGCFMFPDVASSCVSMMYLQLLTNEEEINEYAWGPSMLACLHGSMCARKNGKKNTTNGCTALLIVSFLKTHFFFLSLNM